MRPRALLSLTPFLFVWTACSTESSHPLAPVDTALLTAAASTTCNGLVPTLTVPAAHTGWFNGTSGDDVILGRSVADSIDGKGGDDVICGLGGRDRLEGSGGDDLIYGGDGSDVIRGDGGADRLFGQKGNDDVRGGDGLDYIEGNLGHDYLRGGADADTILGGHGHDGLRGANGIDFLWGGNGADTLIGGNDTDACFDVSSTIVTDCESTIAFSSIDAGDYQMCGVTGSGAGFCWGSGYPSSPTWAMLGDGTTNPSTVPVGVVGGLTFSTIAAGGEANCGLTTAGAAWCWGGNDAYSLGVDWLTAGSSTVPIEVTGGHTFASLSTGLGRSCATTAAQETYCWGYGLLGDAFGIETWYIPTMVAGGHGFHTMGIGHDVSCGVGSASTAWCWGRDGVATSEINPILGRLGAGSQLPFSNAPTAVVGGHTFTTVSTGDDHSCALTNSGDAYCWGGNEYGQLGNSVVGAPGTGESTPQLVWGGHKFKEITVAGTKSCGLVSPGEIYCWGTGYLGNGPETTNPRPQRVATGMHMEALTSGQEYTCGVEPNSGAAVCFGDHPGGLATVPELVVTQ